MTPQHERSDDIQNLRLDMAVMKQIVERLDTALEKITEVSSSVSNILAVQGSRLEAQEKRIEKIHSHIESQEKEYILNFKEVYSYIEEIEKKRLEDHEKLTSKILAEMKALRDTINTKDESVNAKITKLERWSWIAMGGAAVVGWILSHMEKVTSLFV